MVIETKPSFAQFYETRFDDITGIRIGADQCDLGHGDGAGTRRGTNILPSRM